MRPRDTENRNQEIGKVIKVSKKTKVMSKSVLRDQIRSPVFGGKGSLQKPQLQRNYAAENFSFLLTSKNSQKPDMVCMDKTPKCQTGLDSEYPEMTQAVETESHQVHKLIESEFGLCG